MPIPVLRISNSIRYAMDDMQSTQISDFQILEAINQAAALLYGMLSMKFVHAARKTITIQVPETGELELPDDFVRIHQVGLNDRTIATPVSYMSDVEGTYRIIGNKFTAPQGTYFLEYYYIPIRVTKLSDSLDVPLSMSTYIEQISLAIYNRDLARANSLAVQAQQFLSDSEVSHLQNNTPQRVLGGRV